MTSKLIVSPLSTSDYKLTYISQLSKIPTFIKQTVKHQIPNVPPILRPSPTHSKLSIPISQKRNSRQTVKPQTSEHYTNGTHRFICKSSYSKLVYFLSRCTVKKCCDFSYTFCCIFSSTEAVNSDSSNN